MPNSNVTGASVHKTHELRAHLLLKNGGFAGDISIEGSSNRTILLEQRVQ